MQWHGSLWGGRRGRFDTGEKAMTPGGQGLEWCGHKLGNLEATRSWRMQGTFPITCGGSVALLTPGLGSVILTLDFWPPELWEYIFLVFSATELVEICYSSHGKLIQSSTEGGSRENKSLTTSVGDSEIHSLLKLKIELLYDPAIPLLSIYPDKTRIQKDTRTPMFIAALFTVDKTWKQPKCPLTDKWIKKMWYIYTMEYYSAIKRMKQCHLQQHGCN